MVERHPVGNAGTAVVAGHSEAIEAECVHQADRTAAISRLLNPSPRRPPAGALLPPYPGKSGATTVWVSASAGIDPAPAIVRLREAVQQQQWTAGAGHGDEQICLAHATPTVFQALDPPGRRLELLRRGSSS